MTEVQKLVEEAEAQENMKATVTDQYSIETSVAFWREYFRSPRPKRNRAKLIVAEQGIDDGSI